MKRTKNLLMVLVGLLGLMQARNASADNGHVISATAVSKVLGDGRKISSVIIEYDAPIKPESLGADTYCVEDREITDVYADGNSVVIELKTEVNLNASPMQNRQMSAEEKGKREERDRQQGGLGLRAGWSTGGGSPYSATVTLRQCKDIRTVKGKVYKASDETIGITCQRCLVADDFIQEEFISPFTGQALPYNLYIPEDYDPQQKYPLVLFIHDAGVASGEVTRTLYQGNGATSWAEPLAQERHKCFVVAPEYPVITVDDDWNYSHHLDATIALLKDLQQRFSIDGRRIYTSGQSMGCMSSIVMMLKEPELFAGALLVAGKWNPELMGPLREQNLWIISCEGDTSSNTLQSQAVALWREEGSSVSEATWEMDLGKEELSSAAAELAAEGNHLIFTHLTGGNHRATWFVAYGIPAIEDWLFEQSK
ncbi:MAG: alpha/beta hydrolase-fold protein [Candidatus Cryptobacteroides sp.]